MNKSIWLIGASQMAIDYAHVLSNLKVPFIVIGRGEKSAQEFYQKTGKKVISGGLDNYLKENPTLPTHAIVATGIESLGHVASLLINYGVNQILLEKPGGLSVTEFMKNKCDAELNGVNIYIGYNRRFYASVLKSKEIISQDGGVKSFHFEFTEWSHVIEKVSINADVKSNWLLCNSSHVIDLAFYLGGMPNEISSYTSGKLSWHDTAIFTGAGKSLNGALFSYCANWNAPGRWGVEIMTDKHRLYLKPLEKVLIQNIGSIEVNPLETDYSLDEKFKPGIYLQTKSFINGETDNFCTLEQQLEHLAFFKQINSGI